MGVAFSPKLDLTDDESRMGFVLSRVEREKPSGEGLAYTSIFRHGRVEVTVHKVVPKDEERVQKRLDTFAVVDTPAGLRKVNPAHVDVFIKERPVRKLQLVP